MNGLQQLHLPCPHFTTMFRIRTKLVALVPVLPSYLLAKALVSGFFAIGSNEAVENAVSRSREMANALHRRYAQEAVDLAAALAASDETRHMLHSADLEHTPLATSAAAFGPYSLEIYDEELTLIATLATLDFSQQMRTDTINGKIFFSALRYRRSRPARARFYAERRFGFDRSARRTQTSTNQ
jgi:hypothetical protein